MAVFTLVRLMKQAPDFYEAGLGQLPFRERNLQLVALAHVTQIAVAHEAEISRVEMVGGKLLA